jgi:hypothetical protein
MQVQIACICGSVYEADEKQDPIVCPTCNRQTRIGGQSRGLGDTIRKITTALHIPHCGGCEQRQELLNKLVPYRKG